MWSSATLFAATVIITICYLSCDQLNGYLSYVCPCHTPSTTLVFAVAMAMMRPNLTNARNWAPQHIGWTTARDTRDCILPCSFMPYDHRWVSRQGTDTRAPYCLCASWTRGEVSMPITGCLRHSMRARDNDGTMAATIRFILACNALSGGRGFGDPQEILDICTDSGFYYMMQELSTVSSIPGLQKLLITQLLAHADC